MDKKTQVLLALPLALIVLLLFVADSIPFGRSISYAERGILDFRETGIELKEKRPVMSSRHVRGPFDFSIRDSTDEGPEEDDLDSRMDYNDMSLSLIVVTGQEKMAIIGGMLVREGDFIDDVKIERIEKNRVLIRDKTSKWLYPREIQ
ncbi:MAG: hypothetical protein AMK70_00720 [Nitrospira bacterium SG8_35_1]|nr:MAG: hypothetical protein AMK70_00720 [Nitrospira bacterium SG8_35_1]